MPKRKKNINAEPKEPYFLEREEQAVLDYIRSNNKDEKNKIYNEILKKPFKIMVESILFEYPIHHGSYEVSEIIENGLTHLIEKMITYDPNRIGKTGKKSKAFSYCGTIVRNYFKDHGKKTYNDKKINLCFEDYIDEVDRKEELIYELDQELQDPMADLINQIINKIENRIEGKVADNNQLLTINEINVGNAIINILNNWHSLFLEESHVGKYNKKVTNKFTKNKILLFVKEQTGLSTKDVRIAIKAYKELYFMEKEEFFRDEI